MQCPIRGHPLAAGSAFFVLGVVLLAATPGAVGGPVTAGAGAAVPGVAGTLASLRFGHSAPVAVVGSQFWGANVRPYYSLGSSATSTYDAASLSAVRWPGGAVGDRFNVTADRIYNDNGTTSTPAVSEATFVTWCRNVGCSAVIGLPGEIDSPSTAAYYVQYTESTLNFTPAYWEIGNEPALWSHYGISWSHWNTTQNLNATPTTYANLLHAYIKAIRAVDPSAHILGLAGIGTGSWGESGWIKKTVTVNGANLSGIAIHVYPAGGSISGNATVSGFYSTLTGSGALAVRLPADRAAITAGCPKCAPIPVFVTEMGSGTQNGPYNQIMNSFADVPYVAAEVVQAMEVNVSQFDLFAFEASYGGSLLGGNGTSSQVDTLYDDFLAALGPVVLSSVAGPTHSGLTGLIAAPSVGKSSALFVVNTNLTHTFTLTAKSTLSLGLYSSTVWSWNSSMTAPASHHSTGLTIPKLVLSPESVALLLVNTSLSLQSVIGSLGLAPSTGATSAGGAPVGTFLMARPLSRSESGLPS